jgi:hypothetical protein
VEVWLTVDINKEKLLNIRFIPYGLILEKTGVENKCTNNHEMVRVN